MTSLDEPALDLDAPGRALPASRRRTTDAVEAAEPLRENRDFLTVLIGQGVSSFGDAITSTAMPLLVLALTGSGLRRWAS